MQELVSQIAGNRLLRRHSRAGLLHVSGKDHFEWLQGIVTADLKALPDRGFWGLMLQRNGKVRCEVIGIATDSDMWLAVIGGELADVHKYLDSLIVMEDVDLDIHAEKSLWAIHRLTDDAPLLSASPADAHSQASLRWIGERDQVFVISDPVESKWLAGLREAGLEPCEDKTWEQFRVSAGLPKWSVDFTSQDTPHHAGLFGLAVATNKGCYIGQEVVCKVEMIGHVSQRLTRIRLDSVVGVAVGTEVHDGQTGESAGVVTSVAPSLSEQHGWAIARVKSVLIDKHGLVQVGPSRGQIVDMLVG